MFDGKTILITGGTGSFGKKFIKILLKRFPKIQKIVVFSRDELKQFEMADIEPFKSHLSKMRFFIGDIRDYKRLCMAFKDVDYIVHAAALKQVPTAEYNPFECIKTNVLGAQNVIEAALNGSIKKVVALSTDKAVSPINLYGATKLCSDKLFTAANNIKGKQDISFSVVRYGNVFGSRGSVVPYFQSKAKEGTIPITDVRMTRFNITLEQSVDLVLLALEHATGGEVFIPKIPSYKITDLAEAIAPGCPREIVGIRPGEKLHEEMISTADSLYSYDFGKFFVIFSTTSDKKNPKTSIDGVFGKKVSEGFCYASNSNEEWLSVSQIRALVDNAVHEELKPNASI